MANLPSRIGRYEIQELIGTGGMGVLYRAIDPKIANRPVAIKVLRVDDEEMRLRFEREARMIGLLEHPNIVTVYDVGDHDGQPFIAMKFIPGDTLAERIERHPPMPLVERLVLIEQLCDGLAYAHGRGVIHRDIKPVNLMVHEGTGRLMILDFGIARASAQGTGITQIGKLVGTPRFMSPEQLQGNLIDHRSDIFSVGLVLYELLSCRPAFPGQEAPLVAYRVVHESPQSLAEIDPALPTRLTAIVDRAIAKSPAKRYQSLRKMHNDIAGVRQLLGSGEFESTIPVSPIPARPATTTVIALATVAAATGLFVANRFGVDQTDPRPPVDAVDAVPTVDAVGAVPTVDVVDADPPVDVVDEVPTDGVADPVPADGVANPVPADDVVDTAPEGDTEQLTDAEADGAPRTSPDQPDVSAALQRAQAVLESRRFDEAASAFQSVLARDPSSQAARDGLVEANAGAAAHLAQVNQLLGRAEAAFALGDLTTTRATYEEVLTVAPDDERARAGLDAVDTAEALMRGEPTDDIAERIAAARRAFEDGDLATARDEYEKVLVADPDNTPARTGLEAVREAEAIINRPE